MKKKKGVSIILHSKGNILMQLRDDREGIDCPAYWGFFGGHVEENEDPEACITRELEEELEMKIKSPKLFRVIEIEKCPEYVFSYEIDFDMTKLTLREGQRMAFLSLNELQRKKVVPWHIPVLKDFLQSNIYET